MTMNKISLIHCWLLSVNIAHSVILTNFTNLETIQGLEFIQAGRKPWENIRLPPDIQPSNYHLWMHPNLENGTFTGKVDILLDVKSIQKYISVHVKGLKITKTNLKTFESNVSLRNTFEYRPNEFWVIVPDNYLQKGQYKLYLEFSGSLMNQQGLVGFYRGAHKDIAGKIKYTATTKFEPTFARQAFPCFDEPSFKATYDIELVKPAGNDYIALSNMNQIDEINDAPELGLTTVRFNTSKPMSSYLACFIVGDYDQIENNTMNNTFSVRVFARKEQISNAEYTMKIALGASNFYLAYFAETYPLSKLDLIALPDFLNAAMENWGLITFLENIILCDEPKASTNKLLSLTLIVSHEIAHMWFGDLVTMKWWDDLWLNEGFASFINYKAAANIYPSWDVDENFISDNLFPVLKLDAILSSHPIVVPVENPDQISEIFDDISYKKGASVIRMLENTVGLEVFQSGINNYMAAFKYKNAETNDLWSHLNNVSEEIDVRTFMETWTLQMGYPVVTVSVDKTRKNIKFSQHRFLLDSEAKDETFNYSWEVPITFITNYDSKNVQKAWMRKTEKSITIPYDDQGSKLEWLKVNYHHYGYYIVNYEEHMWNKLIAVLKKDTEALSSADRASLLFDVLSLARANLVSYEIAFNLTQYLKNESHYVPWTVFFSEFNELLNRLRGTPAYELCQKYIIKLILKKNSISWDIDDRSDFLHKRYQRTILELACSASNGECLQKATTLFRQWISNPSVKPHPEIADIVLNFGVEQSSVDDWNRLWTMYQNEQDPQEKINFMRALCKSNNLESIQRYLEMGKNGSVIRSQDYLSIINFAARNPHANSLVWDYIRNEWMSLVQRYTTNDWSLGLLIPSVSSLFHTETRLQEMLEFFEKYPEAGAGERGRQRALEMVKNNIKWRNKHLSPVTKWLIANSSS